MAGMVKKKFFQREPIDFFSMLQKEKVKNKVKKKISLGIVALNHKIV
jgi:hypothetical protein